MTGTELLVIDADTTTRGGPARAALERGLPPPRPGSLGTIGTLEQRTLGRTDRDVSAVGSGLLREPNTRLRRLVLVGGGNATGGGGAGRRPGGAARRRRAGPGARAGRGADRRGGGGRQLRRRVGPAGRRGQAAVPARHRGRRHGGGRRAGRHGACRRPTGRRDAVRHVRRVRRAGPRPGRAVLPDAGRPAGHDGCRAAAQLPDRVRGRRARRPARRG